ncbi:HPr family phosphocarrier protein [Fictibacillus barbaricus]|uniref:Phosphotransferase system HPr-like phosphotransfer protein n=1 Tax=Fictibacillus barbaricus TaxID=182136 RepID=A0ABU1TX15_9BACL|nr:HPr family phosphocarrier protein [Fictibacillus barbaricus]MDR7071738.1 phosphotransferase system HPr-like phosphotransfer protein [Fictibacillus barbaricus]
MGAESVVLLPNRLSIGQINEFVNAAGTFESEILFLYQGIQINAKGLLGINLFFLSHYSKDQHEPITLIVEGSDAQEAIKSLAMMLTGFRKK